MMSSGHSLLLRPCPPLFDTMSGHQQSVLTTDDMDDALPLCAAPNPSVTTPLHSQFSAVFDPALCITPDKRAPTTHVELRRPASSASMADELSHSATRVHFDQTVAVHHLSPDAVHASPKQLSLRSDISPCQPPSDCSLLDLSNLSDGEPMSILASDLRQPQTGNPRPGANCAMSYMRPGGSSGAPARPSSNSASLLIRPAGATASNSAASCLSKMMPASSAVGQSTAGRNKPFRSRHNSASPVTVVQEFGSTDGIDTMLGCVWLTDGIGLEPAAGASVLTKPELNSTLRVSRDIVALHAQQFDTNAVFKDTIDAKLRQKVVEKACVKVNADDDVLFPDLISLQVSEDDLLNCVSDERLSRLKQTGTEQQPTDRLKPEVKISRVPDVMDFFTPDLHRESPSVSLVAIAPIRLQPSSAELVTAFDIYRHISTWQY